jgi:DNA-binding HxlR family transcriptional regulator
MAQTNATIPSLAVPLDEDLIQFANMRQDGQNITTAVLVQTLRELKKLTAALPATATTPPTPAASTTPPAPGAAVVAAPKAS